LYSLKEEIEVLRSALEQTESSRTSLAEKVREGAIAHDRMKQSLQNQFSRAKSSWKTRINAYESEKQKLLSMIEELKHEKNSLSHSLREATIRLSRTEELNSRMHETHEKIVKHWIEINESLIRENAYLQTELQDH
jgi:hypothetical protein